MNGEFSHKPTKESILDHAGEVFGELHKVQSWMNSPNSFFQGMRPEDLITYGNPEDLQK